METPDRLLTAALRLFSERGYEAVGVQELCEVAETTKPPLYHHFGSKRGLLEALLTRHMNDWLVRLEAAAVYRGDLPLTLFEVASAFFSFASARPEVHRLLLALWYSAPESAPHQVAAPHLLRQHAILVRLFQEAVRDHGNLRGHHAAYAISLSGILNGYITSLQSVRQPLAPAVAREAVKQFMHGMFAL